MFTINKLLKAADRGSTACRVKIADFLLDNDPQLPDYTSGGWHQTTRMHEDPKKGVVDANCKIHGIDNLYVAGSSCFTTGGAVNPTYLRGVQPACCRSPEKTGISSCWFIPEPGSCVSSI